MKNPFRNGLETGLLIALCLVPTSFAQSARPQTPPPAELRSSFFHGKAVTYQVIDGMAIYQGDITLGRAAELEAARAKAVANARQSLTPQASTNGVDHNSYRRYMEMMQQQ